MISAIRRDSLAGNSRTVSGLSAVDFFDEVGKSTVSSTGRDTNHVTAAPTVNPASAATQTRRWECVTLTAGER